MQNYSLIPQQGSEPADEWIRLGVEAQIASKFDDAERHYRNALRIDPRNGIATHNFAILYVQRGNVNEALLTIDRALLFDPSKAAYWMTKAYLCLDGERIEDALVSARKAVEIAPNKDTRLALAFVVATAGLAHEALPLYNAILDEQPDHMQAGPNACFIQTLCFCSPAELLGQRKRWYEATRYKGERKPHEIDRAWPRPLRVGYVGGDFKTHSAAMIFRNVLLHHDNKAVLPYFYCSLPVDPVNDPFTKLFKDAAGERWRDIHDKDDDKTEALIREDKIDILVDLAGHTNGGRLTLFTRKPAPLQVCAWGFAHGTGCPEIDYFFADPVSVREEERKHFAEKVYDLPCVVTYEDIGYGFPETGDIPYKQNGFITFGSSARYEKLSSQCLGVFAQVMKRVPDAVLRLKDSSYRRPYSIRRVMDAMPDIPAERLHFLIGTNHNEHMLAYRQSDIALDPFPHGGGVVSLEQLWMGQPIVTLYGGQPSGRNTASILTTMGRKEWIAQTVEEYVEIAVALANDIKTVREARKTLRQELIKSPVMAGYREAVERAYMDMWQSDILQMTKTRKLKAVG